MIRVFPSLEHSGGACPHSARQFAGLLCSTYLCSRKKHNRAKPMSELLSALISIADSSEFRFARFNIVYEGAQLVLPESPPIVSGVSDMCPPACPNVEETRNQLQSSGWKKYAHFFRRMLQLLFSRNLACCASCNIVYPRRTVYASREVHYLLPIFQTGFL